MVRGRQEGQRRDLADRARVRDRGGEERRAPGPHVQPEAGPEADTESPGRDRRGGQRRPRQVSGGVLQQRRAGLPSSRSGCQAAGPDERAGLRPRDCVGHAQEGGLGRPLAAPHPSRRALRHHEAERDDLSGRDRGLELGGGSLEKDLDRQHASASGAESTFRTHASSLDAVCLGNLGLTEDGLVVGDVGVGGLLVDGLERDEPDLRPVADGGHLFEACRPQVVGLGLSFRDDDLVSAAEFCPLEQVRHGLVGQW